MICIIGISLAVRGLFILFTHGHWFNTDSYDYIRQADAILAGNPKSYFPNGYPLLIVLAKYLFGGPSYICLLLFLNLLMSTASVVAGYLIGKRLFGRNTGLWIAFVLSLYPNQLNYVREIMSEVPAQFFLMSGLYAFLKRNYLSAAVLLTITCFFRTEFIPVVIILGIILRLKEKQPGRVLRYLAGLLVLCSLIGLLRHEGIIKPPANFGMNVLFAVNADSHHGLDFTTDGYTQEQIKHPVKTYLAFAWNHPAIFASQRLWSLWELWGPWPGNGNEPGAQRGTMAKLLIGSRFIFFLLAGYMAVKRRHEWEVWILMVPVIAITGIHFALYSTPRYEYVVEPLVLILGIAGIAEIQKYFIDGKGIESVANPTDAFSS